MPDRIVYRLYEPRIVNNLHTQYGIALYRNGCMQRVIGDISPDRASVSALARLFSEEGLDPVHFEQAVEDFLYDFTV